MVNKSEENENSNEVGGICARGAKRPRVGVFPASFPFSFPFPFSFGFVHHLQIGSSSASADYLDQIGTMIANARKQSRRSNEQYTT